MTGAIFWGVAVVVGAAVAIGLFAAGFFAGLIIGQYTGGADRVDRGKPW